MSSFHSMYAGGSLKREEEEGSEEASITRAALCELYRFTVERK